MYCVIHYVASLKSRSGNKCERREEYDEDSGSPVE